MPVPANQVGYVFQPRDPAIYCEIYFPHKAAYQGAIYNALLAGRDPDIVRKYLKKSLDQGLFAELASYPNLLDPDLYSGRKRKITGDDKARAEARIDQYRSSFAGWSMYTVAGVFFGEAVNAPADLRPTQRFEAVEELVQVLRLIFRFSKRDLDQASDPLLAAASAADCTEIYRMIVFRTVSRLNRVTGLNPWADSERDRFLKQHAHWKTPKLKPKYEFAQKYFCQIAYEAEHWLDDCSLFVFGFLVRKFYQEVLQQQIDKQEAEIWVTSFLDLSVNVTARPHSLTDSVAPQ